MTQKLTPLAEVLIALETKMGLPVKIGRGPNSTHLCVPNTCTIVAVENENYKYRVTCTGPWDKTPSMWQYPIECRNVSSVLDIIKQLVILYKE